MRTMYRYVDVILKIDPSSGKILHSYDMRELNPKAKRPKSADCFNGIAFNSTDRTLTVTGKYWSKFYRINLPL
jgi:glutaminyl-peptide cyclotransferase